MPEMSRRKKIVVAVIAATVLGIATVACTEAPSEESAEAAEATQPQPKPKPEEQPAPKSVKKQLREEQLENSEEEIEITAEMVVDLTFAEPGKKRLFCATYRLTGDEAGFKAFRKGYGKPVEGAPSAREVFEESASRC
jgi:hypothetical protein